ncbi:hypothetical protein BD311DRAFT_230245 [Dichomitus squalens]|uniref:Zn(2)-C6 fungal-type domain-containing protein n=1 Tax=Dichomitus squalens TaxID=114155 RepID=A0A4V2JYK5_9APHY|nr:hypothetical protein BD311DRAFT_230245 [Dichomitus squalens]
MVDGALVQPPEDVKEVDQGIDGSKPKHKRSRGVKTACSKCRAAGKRCSDNRPCDRCAKYGLQPCVDAESKKKKKPADEVNAGSPDQSPNPPSSSSPANNPSVVPNPLPLDPFDAAGPSNLGTHGFSCPDSYYQPIHPHNNWYSGHSDIMSSYPHALGHFEGPLNGEGSHQLNEAFGADPFSK